jgi:predicted ATPase
VSLKNFKAWRELPESRLAPITGLFGPNSAGKSSIVQLLLLLKQTAESSDRALVLNLGDERSLIELGSYEDLVHGRDETKRVEWSVGWQIPDGSRIAAQGVRFEAAVTKGGSGRVTLDHFRYAFGRESFGMRRTQDGRYELHVEPNDRVMQRERGRPAHVTESVKCYGFPDALTAQYRNADLLADLQLEFENLFSRVYYLGPLRDYPRRRYGWAGDRPSDMGQRGEYAIRALLASAEEGKSISPGPGKRKRSLQEQVAYWLKRLELISAFRVEELAKGSRTYRVVVQRQPGSPEVLLPDVGFGVSQVLPVLTLCFYAPQGSTIILEHPEIHLHPSAQSGLADMLIDAVKTRGVQIIVESHSEYLLRRLQRRLAEEDIKPSDVALFFCESRSGAAHMERLEVNMFGEISNWPEAFFGDEFGEISETQLAACRRRMSAG